MKGARAGLSLHPPGLGGPRPCPRSPGAPRSPSLPAGTRAPSPPWRRAGLRTPASPAPREKSESQGGQGGPRAEPCLPAALSSSPRPRPRSRAPAGERCVPGETGPGGLGTARAAPGGSAAGASSAAGPDTDTDTAVGLPPGAGDGPERPDRAPSRKARRLRAGTLAEGRE